MAVTDSDKLAARIESFMAAFGQAGLRITAQRIEIFRALARSVAHPDAETVFRWVRVRMPTISRDTVYRTLGLLERASAAWRVATVKGRTRYDANTQPHHHFICSRCGCVRDIPSRYLGRLRLPRNLPGLGSITWMHVQATGVCSHCKAGKPKKPARH